MTANELRIKKITKATVKSFIRKTDKLFIEKRSSFNGMSDMVEFNENSKLIETSKEDVLAIGGVRIVGGDLYKFIETDTHYGISIYNCCGDGIIWAEK